MRFEPLILFLKAGGIELPVIENTLQNNSNVMTSSVGDSGCNLRLDAATVIMVGPSCIVENNKAAIEVAMTNEQCED